MRISVKFSSENNIILPKNHNHIIQATILNYLSNKEYQTFIHDEGFKREKRNFKLYTFSRPQGNFSINKDNNTIDFKKELELIISSVDDNLIKYFINESISNEVIRLGRNNVYIEEIKVINKRYEPGDKFYTKSAITIYSTFQNEERKKTYYYSPYESEFEELIRNNLIKKYISYYGKEPQSKEFTIKIASGKKPREMWLVYKGFKIKGWHGEFILDGSKELLKIAYDTGLGAKNSQGFGCVEICDK
ncbi:CRISPR-associated endoribonuclease Cas6 [Clostridium sp. DL1XJH146]